MNDKLERIKNNCFSIASRFVCCYKLYLLVFFIIFFIGFLTGIFTCSGFAKDLEVKHLINPYLFDFLKNEMTFFSYFLTLAVYFLILCLLTIIFARNKFFIGLNAILLSLLAYIFGFDLCVIIICLGLAGVILGLIFMGLLGIFIFSIYICILSIVCKKVLKDKTKRKEIVIKNYSMISLFKQLNMALIIRQYLNVAMENIHLTRGINGITKKIMIK